MWRSPLIFHKDMKNKSKDFITKTHFTRKKMVQKLMIDVTQETEMEISES